MSHIRFFAVPLAAACVAVAFGQEPAVYKVRAEHCSHEPKSRVQSGFRLEGVQGIVTALHGVVDCDFISALRVGSKPVRHLQISQVNVASDAAALTPSADGVVDGPALHYAIYLPRPGATVVVTGFPYETGLLRTDLTVRQPAFEKLETRLEPKDLVQMQGRGSPAISETVLALQGSLVPGLSGAPITDGAGSVVAIANGGLKGGYAQICWAIPISRDFQWKSRESQAALLDRLRSDGSSDLFSAAASSDEQTTVQLKPNEEVFENTIFVLPPGWIEQKDDKGGLVLRERYLPVTITIGKGTVLYDSFRKAFENAIKDAAAHEGIQQIKASEGFEVLRTKGVLAIKNNVTIDFIYVACHPGNRFEEVIFVSPNMGLLPYPAFEAFLDSLDYVNSRIERQNRQH